MEKGNARGKLSDLFGEVGLKNFMESSNIFKELRKWFCWKSTKPHHHCLVTWGFFLVVLMEILAAYNLGPVPIQKIGGAISISIFLFLIIRDRVIVFPGMVWVLLFLAWGIFVTVFHSLTGNFQDRLPPLTTSPYNVFILLRIFSLLSFAATVYVVAWLLGKGYFKFLVKTIVFLGIISAGMAIYIYMAQSYGFPEPPRTRMGTGGIEQSLKFGDPFHRAMGTFREPSHLAEWLIFPFFLSFVYKKSIFNFYSIVLGFVLLLTGSMTGIISCLLGLFLSVLISGYKIFKKILIPLSTTVILALILFKGMAIPNPGGHTSYLSLLKSRVFPVATRGGIKETNRGYAFEYFDREKWPLTGYGLGNSNILLTKAYNSKAIVSFLSLYFNTIFSMGLIGFFLLSIVLVKPLLTVIYLKTFNLNLEECFIVAAYFSWLVIFGGHTEELSIIFGIVYALLGSIITHEGYYERQENIQGEYKVNEFLRLK